MDIGATVVSSKPKDDPKKQTKEDSKSKYKILPATPAKYDKNI